MKYTSSFYQTKSLQYMMEIPSCLCKCITMSKNDEDLFDKILFIRTKQHDYLYVFYKLYGDTSSCWIQFRSLVMFHSNLDYPEYTLSMMIHGSWLNDLFQMTDLRERYLLIGIPDKRSSILINLN
ncbi:hypothetical protein BDB01DRAFT_901140 [Pilobolus umbonatus]|nr:hypothetical protein BDB01DRAFT_901140 [Pilobolus umbonatus]